MAAATGFGSLGVRGLVPAVVAVTARVLVFAMQASYRSIQMIREDVPRHRGRHEIVHRLLGTQPLPYQRRRHVTGLGKYGDDPGPGSAGAVVELRIPAQRIVHGDTGTSDHHEVCFVEYPRKLAPRGNFRKGVGAQDEEQLRSLPAFLLQDAQRVDGIRLACAGQLDVGYTIAVPIGDRECCQRKAVKGRRSRFDRPVRGQVRGNDDDLVQLERRSRGVRRVEMTVVDRVEGASQQT